MTLLELCEPLFQHVCRLKRLSVSDQVFDLEHVRAELTKTFKDVRSNADQHDLINQYERVDLPLIFFVDFTMRQCFGMQWRSFAAERNELAGDEKFFELLDEELADPGDISTQCLPIYFTCLGLGFTGVFIGQEYEIRKLLLKIVSRISDRIDTDQSALICPKAYEGIDTRDMIGPPNTKIAGIGIALVGLIIVWLITCFALYRFASNEISAAVNKINDAPNVTEVKKN